MGEIFAAAIQDHAVGPVIGTTTAGSVAAAQVYGLQDGTGLQVTVLEITSAHGRTLNQVGVTPDRIVELDVAALQEGHDVQLEAAIQAVQPSPMHALLRGLRLARLAA
jgi:carboxyl-terminal processing protease